MRAKPKDFQRTTIRWDAAQLELVRWAARVYGMPYQNYIKDAAFRRAVTDLADLAALKRPTQNTP